MKVEEYTRSGDKFILTNSYFVDASTNTDMMDNLPKIKSYRTFSFYHNIKHSIKNYIKEIKQKLEKLGVDFTNG